MDGILRNDSFNCWLLVTYFGNWKTLDISWSCVSQECYSRYTCFVIESSGYDAISYEQNQKTKPLKYDVFLK